MSEPDNKLNGQIYEFGPFRLAVAERQLRRAGAPVHLTPKVFDLLVVLVESNGRLLDKEELLARVWPDSYVEEGNINRNISTLRRALDGDGEEFIETVPKRGYRFNAPVRLAAGAEVIVFERRVQTRLVVEESSEAAPSTAPEPQSGKTFRWRQPLLVGAALALLAACGGLLWRWRTPPAAPPINAVAILPFKFLGADKADEYLGLALTDTLITRLAGVKPNFVRPTSAVLKYQKDDRDALAAGRALRADAVLDGYVQKFGGMVSVRLQLVRVADGALLSTLEYARPAPDLLLLHDAVTQQVAQALALPLSAEQQRQFKRRYRDSAGAYDAYLQGRYFWNRRGPDWHNKALAAFERALTLDAGYALAYTGLADTYHILGDHGLLPPREVFPKARAAAVKALELDEALAEAHTALAGIKAVFDWEQAAAEREYRRALELDPNYALAYGWYAVYLRRMRRFDEGLRLIAQAQQIDPLLLSLHVYAASIHLDAGQLELAAAQARRALELDPNFWTARYALSRVAAAQGDQAAAVAGAAEAARLAPDNLSLRAEWGFALARAGRRDEARRLLAELQALSARRYVKAYSIAIIHLGLGEHEAALAWLARGLEQRDTFMTNLACDARFQPLRAEARFTELLRRVGLPTQ